MSDSMTSIHGICVSLPSGRLDTIRPLRASVSADADLVEVRLDLVQDPELLEDWVGGWDLPVVAACRREADGGRFRGSEEERLKLLQRAAVAGAALVDIEEWATNLLQAEGWPEGVRFILSKHDLQGPFQEPLTRLYQRLAAHGPALVKLVPTANCLADGFDFLGQLEELAARLGPGDPPLSAFCIGDPGIFTRILAFSRGSSMVYASAALNRSVAPGQVPVDLLTNIYRIREIGPETCFGGILGAQVAGSLSPLIHNALHRQLGLDRCYLPFPASEDELPDFLRLFDDGELPFALGGLSVTAPFKMTVVPFARDLGPCAVRTGAVNTLVRRRRGGLRGYNTDVHGILGTLRASAAGPLAGKRALVIGAGGAARAVAMAVTVLGMELSVVNRTASRARDLAREWGGQGGGLDAFCGEFFHLVVNTTAAFSGDPVGTMPPFQLEEVERTILFDLNYHPPLTPLLASGRRLGCLVLDGLEMLACQGERQFRLFTGRRPPIGAMLDLLRRTAGEGGG